MKYYIGTTNGSGIETDTFDDFIEYLKEIEEIIKNKNDKYFEISIENNLY